MQRVKSNLKLIHPLMNELETLYAELSVKEQGKSLVTATHDILMKPLVDIFVRWGACTHEFKYVNSKTEKIELPKFDKKNIIVCFSGGKDSFVVARHYQKMGYNVYLYHLKGLNATYCGKSSEAFVAEDCAKYMGLPLIIEEISYSGYHEWTEHPMKNIVLLNYALSYGIREGITDKIAVGTFYKSNLVDNAFDVCGGDCVEMFQAYENIIKSVIPKFRVYMPNKNYQTAYNALIKEPEALEHISSCLTPNRFKEHFRARTERNYSISFMPNRCGCCWKDVVEYMWLVDHNVLDLNPRYYLHCLEVLRATQYKEFRYLIYEARIVWNTYMFYPMSKSKMYKELKDATFTTKGKITCTNNNTKG